MTKDDYTWEENALYGPPPQTGGLYKALEIIDCQFEGYDWPNYLADDEDLPFKVGDVIMVVSWAADISKEGDDHSTWGNWVIIEILSKEKVCKFTFHRHDWKHSFERVG